MLKKFIDDELNKDYMKKNFSIIKSDYKKYNCYPAFENIFKAFDLTKYEDIKCVIIGQDPYHKKGYANGLAFSVYNNVKISPSLKNIFKELENDLGIKRDNTELDDWAKEGVLLLNASLSVIEGKPNSHMKYWIEFTNNIIKFIEKNDNPIVYILWGNDAISKKSLITNKNHYVITSSHPSPLGAYKSFFGSKPFSKCNELLKKNGKREINW